MVSGTWKVRWGLYYLSVARKVELPALRVKATEGVVSINATGDESNAIKVTRGADH